MAMLNSGHNLTKKLGCDRFPQSSCITNIRVEISIVLNEEEIGLGLTQDHLLNFIDVIVVAYSQVGFHYITIASDRRYLEKRT